MKMPRYGTRASRATKGSHIMGFMTPWSEGSKAVALRDDEQTLCAAVAPGLVATVDICRLTANHSKTAVLLPFLGSPVCQLWARFRIQSAGQNGFDQLVRTPGTQEAAGSSPVAPANFSPERL